MLSIQNVAFAKFYFTLGVVCGIIYNEEAIEMRVRFYKLFDLLKRRDLTRNDLQEMCGVSSATLVKMSKGENVTTDVIARICVALGVQPGDIMEIEEPKEG